MRKRKNPKKKLIILLSIVICLIVILIIYNHIMEHKAKKDYGYEIMGVYVPEAELVNSENTKEVAFENIDILKEFTGEVPVSTVVKNVKDVFINKMPEIIDTTEDMTEEELKEYYNENKSQIKKDVRIEEEEVFLKMVKTMREIECDLEKDGKICKFLPGEDISFEYTYANGQVVKCKIDGKNSKTFLIEF